MSTAVAAPAEKPTDDCNWLPLRTLARGHHEELCGKPCVQEFDTKVAGVLIRIHRCAEHKLTEEFVGKMAIRAAR